MQPWLRTALTLSYNDISMKMNSPETDFQRCLKSRTFVGCLKHLQVPSSFPGSWRLSAIPLPTLKVGGPFRGGDLASCLASELCETEREAPPTGCEGPCWGLGDLTEAERVQGNDSGKLRRCVRAMEEERDVKSGFFFPSLFPHLNISGTEMKGLL